MKTTRRILTLLLALTLLCSLTLAAFAQEVEVGTGSGSITISNTTIGHTYSIYKIFDATVSADGEKIVYKLPEGKTPEMINDDPVASQWFVVNEAGEVTAKEGFQMEGFKSEDFKSEEFKTWAKGFATDTNGQNAPISSAEAEENSLTFQHIPYGYYLVESSLGAVVSVDSTTPDVTLIDKNQKPSWDNGENSPGKVIIETDEEGKEIKTTVNEANLNEDILFDIGVNAMNYNGEKKIFAYVITDDLDESLSYRIDDEHPLKVTVGGKEIEPYSAENPSGYTIVYYDSPFNAEYKTECDAEDARSFRITLPWTEDGTYDGEHIYDNATEIHVRYYGFLNADDADQASEVNYKEANENKANFTWLDDDNKGDNPKEVTPDHEQEEKKTETYITELELFKYTMINGLKEALEGAEFTLTGTKTTVIYTEGTHFVEDPNGNYWLLKDGTYTTTDPNTEGVNQELYDLDAGTFSKESFKDVQGEDVEDEEIKAYVGEDGKLIFHGLAEGTYTLTESVVPAGYNKAADITFTVVFNKETKTFSVDPENSPVKFDNADHQLKVEVENNSGTELPSTGGIGTRIFYVLGSVLVLGAGIVLISRKRMQAI